MENYELYWNIIMVAGNITNIVMVGILLQRFVKPFLQEGSRIYLVGISYVAAMLILKFFPYEMQGMTAYAVGSTAAWAAMYLVDRRHIEQKIFLAVTFYLLEWISWGIILVPWELAFNLTRFLPQTNLVQLGFYVIRQILFYLSEYVVMFLLIRVIQKTYICKEENLTPKELVLMLAPSLSIIAGRLMVLYFSTVYEKDLGQAIWNGHWEYDWVRLLYQVLSFGAMLTVIIIYQRIKAAQRQEKQNTVLSRQIEDMERHVREVEQLYAQIRCLKHDMGNHIITLEQLCAEDKNAGEYLEELRSTVCEVSEEIQSGNPVTDVILREKKKEAREKGIAFCNQFYYPSGKNVSAFDVSIILNNALDNAIEAASCCEEAYIEISCYGRKNAYIMEVKNSVAEERAIDTESGLPMSTKKEAGHGYGLASIRNVAQKYHGDILIEQNGKEFVLVILLMIEKEK